MDRLEYAERNKQRYLDWCAGVESSPFDDIDKLEFAIISAHTLFDKSIDGFLATRNLDNVTDIGNALYNTGVIAPGNKAAYIVGLRDDVLECRIDIPSLSFREYRKSHKIAGLGYCKLSFGCCLINPMESDVVCLDTHILQVYMGRRPTPNEINRHYQTLGLYVGIEDMLIGEAEQIGLPAFAYQWAVWDWKRAKVDHKPPSDHSFLWQGGQTIKQLPLFSGLE